MRYTSHAIAFAACLGLGGHAHAAEDRDRRWFATVYAGKWAQSNMGDIPARAFTGRLDFYDAYIVTGSLSYVAVPSIDVERAWLKPLLDGSSLELEGLVGQHMGDQNHVEVAFTLFWRSPEYALPGRTTINFAVGEGLSYALSKPRMEGSIRGAPTHQFLNYLAFEAELSHPALPGVSFVPRLHHRSGIFGVIAPRSTGSNFVGAGIRVQLQ